METVCGQLNNEELPGGVLKKKLREKTVCIHAYFLSIYVALPECIYFDVQDIYRHDMD